MTTADSAPYRRRAGGRIDRSRTLSFVFDGQERSGHPGDTLASALLAHGVRTVTRSIHLDRPRGIVSAGEEEPGSLVQVESGVGEPSRKATRIELHDGLQARGLRGKGVLTTDAETARYDHRHVHVDVLVVGAGPAGLAAALAAGRTGARVMLVDDQPQAGGDLLNRRARLNGQEALTWVEHMVGELRSTDEVRIMSRTTAVGYYDDNEIVLLERRTEHLGDAAPEHVSRQRLWHVRARQVVLATGAHERPLVFTDNDRPGIMLASSASAYVNRYGVLPGRRAVVATTNDSAYQAALDLLDAGVEIVAVVDARTDPGPAASALRERGVPIHTRCAVREAIGAAEVTGVRVSRLDEHGQPMGDTEDDGHIDDLSCDLLGVSGGWNPVVHLFSQSGGRLRFDERQLCYVPDVSFEQERTIGAARGVFGLSAGIAEGAAAGRDAAVAAGFAPAAEVDVPQDHAQEGAPSGALWMMLATDDAERDRQFVDLERDATVLGITRAVGAGMRSVQHVKRYTTIGTASDQGRTSGVTANGVLSVLLGSTPGEVGTTTYRPPYVPVSFALLAGRNRGALLDPVRTTPMHAWHEEHGAVFEDVGQWKRPWFFPRDGEDMEQAVLRECAAARDRVGVLDATTLGKIEIVGKDASEFLNRIYTNAFAKLPVGRCRYGLMCSADGMILDDGVTARLAQDRFLMSTTTGNAATVLDWLEEWLQTEWPELEVFCTSVTEQWAAAAVVGPRSRDVIAALAPELDVSNEAFPFMTFREATVAGMPARIFRISFSGELAYEIHLPSVYGMAMWEAVIQAGARYDIMPYGTETMHVLRAEKGYIIVGQDTDGTVTPPDAGLGWAVSKKKDFIGKRSLYRPDTARDDRKQLVGLLPVDPHELLPEGAQLVTDPAVPIPMPMIGHVTSSYRSAAMGRTFALALVADGTSRTGERLHAPLKDRTIEAEVTDIVFYDPQGERRDG